MTVQVLSLTLCADGMILIKSPRAGTMISQCIHYVETAINLVLKTQSKNVALRIYMFIALHCNYTYSICADSICADY